MKHFPIILVLLIVCMVSCEKENKEGQRLGKLEGIIRNEFGQPIEGALIEMDKLSTKSNSIGRYLFDKLPVKEYSVSVSKGSFITNIQKVTIIEKKTLILDFSLSAGEPYLYISSSSSRFNANSGSFNINVSSNAGWTIENTSTWLTSSIGSGNGNRIVTLNYSRNLENSNRTDTIHFISGSIKASLIINQSAPLKIIKYEGIIGDGAKDIKDSVYILFNKPVIIKFIKSNTDLCLSEISYNLTDNNYGVKFTYSCAELGGNYPFTISVSDADNNTLSEDINIPFYNSKIDMEGFMTDYLLINDEKEILISAISPSRLIKYSLVSNSIIQIFDLSQYISPIKISYNPYNSKVYILGSNPDASLRDTYINRPDVYTLDLLTSQIVKAFTIEPDMYDHPQYPANIPYNLGFTKSGHGVVLLKSNGASSKRWKLIDCNRNDTVYRDLNYDSPDFDDVHMNYDNTKLYLSRSDSSSYGIFDGVTQQISILQTNSTTRSIFITPNKKTDKFYAGRLYDQFIIDLSGNKSLISYIDNRADGSADFSYREKEENLIYFCEKQSFYGFPNRFYVVDYSSLRYMWCDLVDGFEKFTATLDGKQAIAYKLNGDLSSSLYFFKTDGLTRHFK